MASCELCGRKDAIYSSEIEGTVMKVCEDCAKFGKTRGKAQTKIVIKESKKLDIKEPTYIFFQGYGAILKNAREKMGLKQEELAKKINERESTLHQLESEHFKPSVDLARKLEKTLHVHIMEEIKDEENKQSSGTSNSASSSQKKSSEGFTLGDMIKNRK